VADAVLIIGDDAAELAQVVQVADPEIPLTTAVGASDAREAFAGQPILFGSPLAISKILSDLPEVKWVQSSWAGVTPLIDLDRRDYVLTGVRGVFGPQMSEYVLGYLLAHELDILGRHEDQLARRWAERPSGRLQGKRLGIMGTGSIGQAIAEQAAGFGVAVTGLSRSGATKRPFETVYPIGRIDEFLPRLDYLVAVLPDLPSTRGLLHAGTLALLSKTAFFVNVGRGNVVDDDALVAALAGGNLAGAVLDVFHKEPLPGSSRLWDAPNLHVTAHIAASSDPELIVPVFLDNYRRFAAGEPMADVVDFERGY